MAGVAGALLPVHLLAGDGYLRAVLHVVCAGHALQLLIAHHAVDQVRARLEAEDGIVELHFARAARIEGFHGGLHGLASVLASAGGASFAALASGVAPKVRTAPGLGASLCSGRFTASR